MKVKLIANPVSGGTARASIDRAVTCLQEEGADVELFLTGGRGDARTAGAAAVAAGFDRVVVAGGDGTLNEVVNGVYPADVPIAFLPLGTVNVFALETAIPREVEVACHLAVHGTPRHIGLGRIDKDLFLLMASAGWDADAVFRLRPGVKRVIGRAAYGLSALEALLSKAPRPFEVILAGGEPVTAYGVVVSNCRYYGGRYLVTPNASLFSETLEVCVLHRPGRLALLQFALSLALRQTLPRSLARFYTADSVTLHGERVPVQVDGDAWGALPASIESVPAAINMILPNEVGYE